MHTRVVRINAMLGNTEVRFPRDLSVSRMRCGQPTPALTQQTRLTKTARLRREPENVSHAVRRARTKKQYSEVHQK